MKINHIGVSGGKDSQALMVWAIKESGLPLHSIRITFCNTHNEDEVTYNHIRLLDRWARENGVATGIEWLEPAVDEWMKDEKVAKVIADKPHLKGQAFFLLALKKRRFPSRKAQFCTDHLKIRASKVWVKSRMEEGHEITMLSGVRADESFERSKLPERENAVMSKWGCEAWRPLLKWTIADVYAISARYGLPLNPLYAMGAKRVGCFPCVNCGKREIKLVAKNRPEKIAQIREWEQVVGTTCRHAGYSSFFQSKTVTMPFRRGPYIKASGKEAYYTTIDDVVSWAHTERGGKQFEFQFDEDQHSACSSRYGQCE